MERLNKNYPSLQIEFDSDIIEIPYITNVENLYDFFINKITIVYGPTQSRKTTLVKNIMLLLKDYFPIVAVYSPNNRVNGDFLDIVPPNFIYKDISIELLKRFYHRQEDFTNKYITLEREVKRIYDSVKKQEDIDFESKNKHRKNLIRQHMKEVLINNKYRINTTDCENIVNYFNSNTKFLLILDDMSSTVNDFFKKTGEPIIKKLFFESRHVNISFICILHNPTDLLPAFRNNAHTNIFCDKSIARSWFSKNTDPHTKKLADKVIDEIFRNKDNKMIYDKDGNKYYYMVPEVIDNFRMGYDALWKMFRNITR